MKRDESKNDLRSAWESAAPGRAKWEQELPLVWLKQTDALLEMAGVESGMRVLDLACGVGIQSIQAAKRVGRREFVRSDETAIWKRILLQAG